MGVSYPVRFFDVLPVLLACVRSRQAPGKPVLWVAHNAKRFDVPFLTQEFGRCSAQVPTDWLFVDSLSLARKLKKSDGDKNLVNLEVLGKRYSICAEGPSHRAMPDVTALCHIFQKITLDLKLTNDVLMNEAIRFSDIRKDKWITISFT
ncbi:exonuclease DPD1, chloroplastic/mitochondrial-like isoform X2 [Phragmites australis]|uniref:exonuclease DPD1, chloroplastic/mitochondrial-like isoform X2 n=1 Tax=Phragmites australis TaxID=29695 RepID=UPI002D77695B|nr:exonuclease DPD1, chloroplastic/mitochondrial-like isoform X2 [Phragmites australis]